MSTVRKRIAILTTGRQDWSILRSTVQLLCADPRFEVLLWAGGMHLSARHGRTVDLISADGLPIAAQLDFLGDAPDPGAEAARALALVSAEIARARPDALVLLGDRSETCAAGLAAVLAAIPIVHLHGGEESEGAVDNSLRHALTKMAHLHLVSHPRHAKRVRQMGEPDRGVVVVGAAGLDNLSRADLPDREALGRQLGGALPDPIVVVTLHATTLGGDPAAEVAALQRAMGEIEATWVITQPNADVGGQLIRESWLTWARGRARTFVTDSLGDRGFWGALRLATAMLGNSSAGIIEAPAAGMPVVNVGDRQAGRLRSAHIVDVPFEPGAIAAALRVAISPARKAALAGEPGTYPSGLVAPRIVEVLARWDIPRPPRKRFVDLPAERGTST